MSIILCGNCGQRLLVNLVKTRKEALDPAGQGYARCPHCGHFTPVQFRT